MFVDLFSVPPVSLPSCTIWMWCNPETACGFLHSSVARGSSVVRIGRYEPLTYAKSADMYPHRSAAQGIDPRSRRARRGCGCPLPPGAPGAVAVQRAFTAVK